MRLKMEEDARKKVEEEDRMKQVEKEEE